LPFGQELGKRVSELEKAGAEKQAAFDVASQEKNEARSVMFELERKLDGEKQNVAELRKLIRGLHEQIESSGKTAGAAEMAANREAASLRKLLAEEKSATSLLQKQVAQAMLSKPPRPKLDSLMGSMSLLGMERPDQHDKGTQTQSRPGSSQADQGQLDGPSVVRTPSELSDDDGPVCSECGAPARPISTEGDRLCEACFAEKRAKTTSQPPAAKTSATAKKPEQKPLGTPPVTQPATVKPKTPPTATANVVQPEAPGPASTTTPTKPRVVASAAKPKPQRQPDGDWAKHAARLPDLLQVVQHPRHRCKDAASAACLSIIVCRTKWPFSI
jgi:hypothetical protein